jgi:hypothetical protein
MLLRSGRISVCVGFDLLLRGGIGRRRFPCAPPRFMVSDRVVQIDHQSPREIRAQREMPRDSDPGLVLT